MGNLMAMEDREIQANSRESDSERILELRKKIADEAYLEHAIKRIASELTHQLTK